MKICKYVLNTSVAKCKSTEVWKFGNMQMYFELFSY